MEHSEEVLRKNRERRLRIEKEKNPDANLTIDNIKASSLSEEEQERLKKHQGEKKEEIKQKKEEETLLNQIYYHFRVNPREKTPEEVAEMALALKAGVEMEINIMEIACTKALAKLFKK